MVVGDISKEFFGMSQEEYDKLSKTCSVIYNCASNVNFMAPIRKHISPMLLALKI